MKPLKVLGKRQTFVEVLEDGIDFQPPAVRQDSLLFTNFAQAATRFNSASRGLQRLCRDYCDVDLPDVQVHGLAAQAAALPFEQTMAAMQARLRQAIGALADAVNESPLGHATWIDRESCQVTFAQAQRRRGMLTRTVRREQHTHDLVKAREHRLPARDVSKPKRIEQIIRAIPDVLRPGTRIITGMLVLHDASEESRRQEATWLGRSLSIRRVAGVAALAAFGGAVVSALAGASSVATAVGVAVVPLAIADPAVSIGDLVLAGWLDGPSAEITHS